MFLSLGKHSMVWLDAIKQVLRGQKSLQNNKDLIKTKKMTCGLKKNHLIDIYISFAFDYSRVHKKFQLTLTFFGEYRI